MRQNDPNLKAIGPYVLTRSIPESAIYLVDEIGVKPGSPTPNQMGRLYAHLAIMRTYARFDDDTWDQFLDYLAFPDDNPCPACCYLPKEDEPYGAACLAVVEEIYQTCPLKE